MRAHFLLAVIFAAALAHGQGEAPSDAAAVLALARQSALAPDPDPDAARFLALMDRLGAAPSPAAADPSPEAEVARVARARAAAPALVAELEQRYVMTYDRRSRGQGTYPPLSEHLSERYRYAWEWLLLRSNFLEGASAYGFRALEALGQIHDDASLPLLVRLCEGDAANYHLGFGDEAHRSFLGEAGGLQTYVAELTFFRSVRGLEAIVACAQAIERAQGGEITEPGKGVDVGKILRRELRPKYSERKAAAWMEAETEYRRDPAHREGARLLDRLLVEPPPSPNHREWPRRTPPPAGG